jgi:phosphoribosyl 1,2-cyclic phosphodiesterase
MSFSFCILGSGSAGNCTALCFGAGADCRVVLIDAGLSPRQTMLRLQARGLHLRQVSDILFTHFDGDHLHPGWIVFAERLGVRLRVHRDHLRAAAIAGLNLGRIEPFVRDLTLGEADQTTKAHAIRFAHDDLGSIGFIITHGQARLGFATDLGHAPTSLFEQFVNLHALAIESNYDRNMQLASGRPPFLKRRIMGGAGHLSNEQSLDAILRIAQQSQLGRIALLHLSRQCNDPARVKALYRRRAPHLLDMLMISNQLRPTPMMPVAPRAASQPGLFDASEMTVA